jgi:hypothetical protein
MKFLLVFAQSGDVIPFESLNDSILEFYIDYLNTHNLNEFVSKNPNIGNVISQRISALHDSIQEVNNWIEILLDPDKKIKTDSTHYYYLNQDVLNAYHDDWVNSQTCLFDIDSKRRQYNYLGLVEQVYNFYPDEIKFPTVGDIIDKLRYKETYDNINFNIHDIEESFNIRYTVKNQNRVEIKNPFLHQGLSHNTANFKIAFNHLGRTLYNKFLHRDIDLQYQDENTYNELIGFVDLNLQPPETVEMSVEYKEWCKSHGRNPLGENLNLGNIPNLDKHLTDYRIIIYRNLLKNNSFSIQLI